MTPALLGYPVVIIDVSLAVEHNELGPRTYRAPTGGAIIFSCSLLHEAQPVTRGRRYAFLPFFYDDAAAAIRVANNGNLGDNVAQYRFER